MLFTFEFLPGTAVESLSWDIYYYRSTNGVKRYQVGLFSSTLASTVVGLLCPLVFAPSFLVVVNN